MYESNVYIKSLIENNRTIRNPFYNQLMIMILIKFPSTKRSQNIMEYIVLNFKYFRKLAGLVFPPQRLFPQRTIKLSLVLVVALILKDQEFLFVLTGKNSIF